MKHHTDQDGKSKTASGADAAHYPEQHEVNAHPSPEPNHSDIAKLAHELWVRRGCPQGSADNDWFEATDRLRAKTISDSTRSASSPSGSVQR